MTTVLGYPLALLLSQLVVGLINGAFYALLSLGLAIIFGMLRIVNFAHGALFMLGALFAWMLLQFGGVGYWWALVIAPLAVGILGAVMERLLIRHVYNLDHLYGMLLTFGITEVIEGLVRNRYGSIMPYGIPPELEGTIDLGFMYLPLYRAWVIVVAAVMCLATWLLIEKTRLGATLRAANENPALVRAFGVNVPRLLTLTYAGGVALAAFAGVLAAPIYSVGPQMGTSFVIIVFAVVVIGGMGSIMGAVVTGFALGLIEGLTKVVYPEASSTVIFLVMIAVLLTRPAGLFGKEA